MSQPGYTYLKAYMFLVIIDHLTHQFCFRYLPGREYLRQREQMTQAARSSKQCLVEGCTQSSLKGYIKLTGIAHSSNQELREDYLDFLHYRRLPVWPKSHPQLRRVSWVSRVCREISQGTSPTIPPHPTNPTQAANLMLDLTTKAGFLLSRLISSLKKKHQQEGGLTENLYRSRKKYRGY